MASHQAYEAEWDNWTANNSHQGTPLLQTDDPQPDDGAANVINVHAIQHRKDQCILDSGADRIVFNNESWIENSNSFPLTPTNATIHGISGNNKASMQTVIGNLPILIFPI